MLALELKGTVVWQLSVRSVPFLSSKECAKRIAKVSAEAKLEIDEETYLSSFKPHLMDVVHTWATGATFAHICKMTDVFEGRAGLCVRVALMEHES